MKRKKLLLILSIMTAILISTGSTNILAHSVNDLSLEQQKQLKKVLEAVDIIATDKGDGSDSGPAGTWFLTDPKWLIKIGFLKEGDYDKNASYGLTCDHIAGNKDIKKIKVFMNDDSYIAELLGTLAYTDVAVLKIPVKLPSPGIKISAKQSLDLAQTLIVTGNPYLFRDSVSIVKVSKRGPFISGRAEFFMNQYGIYYDAPINLQFWHVEGSISPGSSGSPLLYWDAEISDWIVIGICSRGIPGSGRSFFEPMDLMIADIATIIKDGKVERGWLGITTVRLANLNNPDTRNQIERYIKWPFTKNEEIEFDGLMALDIYEDSFARGTTEMTKLEICDVITHVSPITQTAEELMLMDQYTPITDPSKLIEIVREKTGFLKLLVWRQGKTHTIILKIKNIEEVAYKYANKFRIFESEWHELIPFIPFFNHNEVK